MMKATRKLDTWQIISFVILGLYALFLVLPLFQLLRSSVINDEGQFTWEFFQRFFGRETYYGTLFNSFKVACSVTVTSLIVGILFSYFYSLFDLKGKAFLQVMAILACMSPPVIGAYSWIQMFGRGGIITKFLRSTFAFRMPDIYGFGGIVLVITCQLFPLVFLYINGALKNIDNSLIEASSGLGCNSFKRFFKVILPLCMPTILAAGLLVFMRAFADFSTPLLIGKGYQTFPVLIYNSFVGETSRSQNFASAVSVVGIVVTALIFFVQKFANAKFNFTMNALHSIETHKPRKLSSILMHIYCYFIVFVAMMPQFFVAIQSFRKCQGGVFQDGFSLDSYIAAFDKILKRSLPNTFLIGITALLMVIFLAILIAYLVVRRANTINGVIDTLSMVPYIIPGAVVGIALVITFNRGPLVLTGTAAIMIIALIIRRLPYTIRSSVAILQQIPLSIEEAAISLGCSKLKAFFTITVPMMTNGIMSGAIISWITIITELSTAIVLYSVNTETLTLTVYTSVVQGNDGVAAAVATILLVVTTISLLLFMKFSKNKDIAF
ncbi:MAG: iron ABC transporter permease [Clostridia bacterium]|nr:iron ABC transporter permease [Clostridia bacterium]